MGGSKRFGDHAFLVPGDVRTGGTAEIEHASRVRRPLRAAKIACHQAAKVLGERDPQIAGALAGSALHLRRERDLGA